ncbi:hypothetical protein AWC38_SpisGene20755 [Stylophora pistillata]|uniref:Uncharacterized protein n=1 Tax=Stylophora pistillata TaxID=50429 RepID=A0A2B4RFL6_STYPI|nr:hypothetical protein AWC38_SpisGene20755 [Stylophora pistillata]
MRKASREVIFINTSPPEDRVELLKPLNDIKDMEDDCEEIYTGGLLKRYSKRPIKFEHVTFADWAAWYDSWGKPYAKQSNELDTDNLPVETSLTNNDDDNESANKVPSKLKKRTKPRIIRSCWFNKEKEPEKHYRELIMLFTPWINEETDIIGVCSSYKERYMLLSNVIYKQMEQYAVCNQDFNEMEQEMTSIEDSFDSIAPATQSVELQDEAEVMDSYIFKDMNHSEYAILAPNLWNELFKMFELDEIMRQRESKEFAEMLNRLREGKHTEQDIVNLKQRMIKANNSNYLLDAPHLSTEKEKVNKFNDRARRSISGTKYTIKAHDSVIGATSTELRDKIMKQIPNLEPKNTKQLHYNLNLAVEERTEISLNTRIDDGITNGARNVIKLIQLHAPDRPSGVIWVQFDHADVGATFQCKDVEEVDPEEEEPKPSEPKGPKISRGLAKTSSLQSIQDRYFGVLEIIKKNQCSLAEAMRISGVPRNTLRDYIGICELRVIDQEKYESALEGYMHGLSKIKTASNGTTTYFDLKLQTSDDKTVRLVCFSPPKRSVLLTAYEKRSPVKIEANLNPKKRYNSDLEKYTAPKRAKIMPTELKFNFNENLDNHLHAVSQALQANIYTTVDLKVKVIIKEENKNPIVQDTKNRYKCDTLVADETGFEEIDDIQNINVDTPEIKNNLLKVKVELSPVFQLNTRKLKLFKEEKQFEETHEAKRLLLNDQEQALETSKQLMNTALDEKENELCSLHAGFEKMKALAESTKKELSAVTQQNELLKSMISSLGLDFKQFFKSKREQTSTSAATKPTTRHRRRKETEKALKCIHGGSSGSFYGAWDYIVANAPKKLVGEFINGYKRGRYIQEVFEKAMKEHQASPEALKQAIATKYQNFLS